ncbi:hypothetical protein DPEC_G00245000 [Dallia pectoralis]|uniref:Uncharacterized protein n=1 Tax=Dallia pectoralis TaxID=75939 RepID=A0ACC2FVW2_DALPE|nr:hypothetical protein DPEC_G00245000 [Dallia pectoralis]
MHPRNLRKSLRRTSTSTWKPQRPRRQPLPSSRSSGSSRLRRRPTASPSGHLSTCPCSCEDLAGLQCGCLHAIHIL